MDSVEYSVHLTRVGKDVMRVAEHVEAAADNDVQGDVREAAITQARAKLADYDKVFALLTHSKILQAQFAKKFAFHIDLIRESLEKVDTAHASGQDPASTR